MGGLTRAFVVAFGATLCALGLFFWFSGELTLPTRSPPARFHFSGFPLFLLGASPLVLGGVALLICFGVLDRQGRPTFVAIGAGGFMLALAFVLAPKL